MSDLALLSADPSVAELAADPGQFVVLACERAKEWLAHAVQQGAIEDVVNVRSQAEAIRVFTAQKQLGKDAELSAAEIVRRAERGIAECIRRGQDDGVYLTGDGARAIGSSSSPHGNRGPMPIPPSPAKAAGVPQSTLSEYYSIHDGSTEEQFDSAIGEAKAEGNLSRANVIRKLRPDKDNRTSDRPDVLYKKHRLDSNRIVEQTVIAVQVSDEVLASIDFMALDQEQLAGWIASLSASVRSLQTLLKQLKRESNPE